MSAEQPLLDALAALGQDADEIAGRLKDLGYRGRRSVPGDCPVAHYLRESFHRRVRIGSTFCSVGGANFVQFPLPPAVMEFVDRFDGGAYSWLVDDAPHEDGCPADRDDCMCER